MFYLVANLEPDHRLVVDIPQLQDDIITMVPILEPFCDIGSDRHLANMDKGETQNVRDARRGV